MQEYYDCHAYLKYTRQCSGELMCSSAAIQACHVHSSGHKPQHFSSGTTLAGHGWGVFWYIFIFICWLVSLIKNRLMMNILGILSSPCYSFCQERKRDRFAICAAFSFSVQKASFFHQNVVCWLREMRDLRALTAIT